MDRSRLCEVCRCIQVVAIVFEALDLEYGKRLYAEIRQLFHWHLTIKSVASVYPIGKQRKSSNFFPIILSLQPFPLSFPFILSLSPFPLSFLFNLSLYPFPLTFPFNISLYSFPLFFPIILYPPCIAKWLPFDFGNVNWSMALSSIRAQLR